MIEDLEKELSHKLREKYYCFERLQIFLDVNISMKHNIIHVCIITREYLNDKYKEYCFNINFTKNLNNFDDIIKDSIMNSVLNMESLKEDEKTYKSLYDKEKLFDDLNITLKTNSTTEKKGRVKV